MNEFVRVILSILEEYGDDTVVRLRADIAARLVEAGHARYENPPEFDMPIEDAPEEVIDNG